MIEFKHWLKCIDIHLEGIESWKSARRVLRMIRIHPTKIDNNSLEDVLDKLDKDETELNITRADWHFNHKSPEFYQWLLPLLNADLAEVAGKEENHGLEVYRLITNEKDEIPADIDFTLEIEIQNMSRKIAKDISQTRDYGKKIDLKATEFLEKVGTHADTNLLKRVLWAILDYETASWASQKGLNNTNTTYTSLKEFIETRYKLMVGRSSKGKGDKMELDALKRKNKNREGEEEWSEDSQEEDQHLDAFGRPKGGKGKGNGGKGIGDNICYKCNGKGHFSRDCPTADGSTATHTCRGCQGKGHYDRECPTTHPELRSKGKGKGKGDSGKGKGKGKSFSSIDWYNIGDNSSGGSDQSSGSGGNWWDGQQGGGTGGMNSVQQWGKPTQQQTVRRLNMIRVAPTAPTTPTTHPTPTISDCNIPLRDSTTDTGIGWEVQRKQRQGDRKRERRGRSPTRREDWTDDSAGRGHTHTHTL